MRRKSEVVGDEIIVRTGGRRRRVVAFQDATRGPLCVRCALLLHPEIAKDPVGQQNDVWWPVYASERAEVNKLRGETCYGPFRNNKLLTIGKRFHMVIS